MVCIGTEALSIEVLLPLVSKTFGRGAFSFSAVQLSVMKRTIHTLEEFEAEAAAFTRSLSPGTGATLITLSGELGAGKTAFTKAAAHTLGVAETVSSPTFVLEKIYLLPPGQLFKRLIHIDAYRLEQGSELAPLGFNEFMQNSENLILLEWPEKVADALPVPSKKLSLIVQSDGSRTISYD